MKTWLGIFALVSMAHGACTGASPTWTATTDEASVSTCVSSAVSGDTVNVQAGSATWSSALTITTGITLAGAGIDTTTITFSSGQLDLNPSTSLTTGMRITGFTFTGAGSPNATLMMVDVANPSFGTTASYAAFQTNGSNLRIDHVKFTPNSSNHAILWGFNSRFNQPCHNIYGLLDHDTFIEAATPATFIIGEGCNENWSSGSNLGTVAAVYIEDSTFTCNTAWTAEEDVVDSDYGFRYVVRHNTMSDCSVLGHDVGSLAQSSGQRAWEIYSNTFNSSGVAAQNEAISFRGGTGVWYSNNAQVYGGVTGMNDFGFTQVQRDTLTGSSPTDSTCAVASARVCSDLRSHCSGGLHVKCGVNENAGQACSATTCAQGGDSAGCGTCTDACTLDSACGSGNVCLNNGAGGGVDGTGTSGLYCRNQSGASVGSGAQLVQSADPTYSWLNCNTNGATTAPCASGAPITGASELQIAAADAPYIANNREFYGWNTSPGTNQTTGTASGLLSNRPSSCTQGVGYWATDTSTLYQCGASNTWSTHYTPYAYPHPLSGAGVTGGGSATSGAVTISGATVQN